MTDDLQRLKSSLENGADIEMQKMYPEGLIFMNAVYALSWSSFVKNNKGYLDEGRSEIDKAWNKINKDESVPPGSFYNGWNTYILGSSLKLQGSNRDKEQVDQFKHQCDLIAQSLKNTTYPESYPNQAWPADVTVCVASLSLHDKLFEPKYKQTVTRWLDEVKSKLDSRGMIPHSLHEDARGSSMAVIMGFGGAATLIADAFVAWDHSNMPVDEPNVSFFEFHLYSTLACILFLTPLLYRVVEYTRRLRA